MSHKRTIWFAVGLLILSSLACNAFAGEPEPALTLPPPPVGVTDVAPITNEEVVLAPTATLPGAVTDVPIVDAGGNPLLEALVDVNIRTGPGVQYNRDGFLFAGETAQVVGQDPVSGWWKVACPSRSSGAECWVSGGTQYTKVTNGAGVPVAAVPPTPTPIPTPEPAEGPDGTANVAATGLLAYVDDDGLWLVVLDMSQDSPSGSEPVQIADRLNIERPMISPDGRKIAYLTSTTESNTLRLINLDESSDKILVRSSDLPVIVETDTAVLLGQIEWLNNSQGLVFNTYMLNLIGPGAGEREDLWSVSLSGALEEQVMAGSGGGTFALSPSGRVIFGQAEAISRADFAGDEADEVADFDFINTASEYIYYPQAQWTADGSAAYVAVPEADPWVDDAGTVLWRIPANGPAVELETLPGNVLFDPVRWTPTGDKLAYVMLEIDASNPPPVLMLADGDGRNAEPYTSDAQINLYGWSLDGSHFLYAGSDYYAIGQVGVPPTKIEVTGGTADMQWLTPSSFIVATGEDGTWNLRSSSLDGETTPLATANDTLPQFDVWSP
jgi:hypothetical protein